MEMVIFLYLVNEGTGRGGSGGAGAGLSLKLQSDCAYHTHMFVHDARYAHLTDAL